MLSINKIRQEILGEIDELYKEIMLEKINQKMFNYDSNYKQMKLKEE